MVRIAQWDCIEETAKADTVAAWMDGVRKRKKVKLLSLGTRPTLHPRACSEPPRRVQVGKRLSLTLYSKPGMSVGHQMSIPGDGWVWGVWSPGQIEAMGN